MNIPAATSVLIVEDEPRMRDLLQRALPDMGCSARAAKHAEEALRMMAELPAQIAILDLNLPGMSGIELFTQLHRRWPDTAVIILTGYGDLESAKAAIRLGVVDFLTKPCHLGDLEAALDRARRRIESLPREPDLKWEEGEPALPPAPDRPTLADTERAMILDALSRNHGNRNTTATELGISVRTLYYRLAEYEKQGFSVE